MADERSNQTCLGVNVPWIEIGLGFPPDHRLQRMGTGKRTPMAVWRDGAAAFSGGGCGYPHSNSSKSSLWWLNQRKEERSAADKKRRRGEEMLAGFEATPPELVKEAYSYSHD